jgi:hypothetical protein
VDPVSGIVGALVVAALLSRLPDTLRELGAAMRGEESPRAQRLAEAGINPASGGAFRQYVGNTWRDAWLDAEQRRTDKRAARNGAGQQQTAGSRWGRWSDAAAVAATAHTDRWRTAQPGAGADGDQADRSDPGGDGDRRDPIRVTATVASPQPTMATPPAVVAAPAPAAIPPPPTTTTTATQSARTPLRTTATVGAPVAALVGAAVKPAPSTAPAIEGDPDMRNALAAGGGVTGVASGAAEARRIQRATLNLTANYRAAMNQLLARINQLGAEALATVQLSQNSLVAQNCAAAAETAAAARGETAAACEQIAEFMRRVAMAFDSIAD